MKMPMKIVSYEITITYNHETNDVQIQKQLDGQLFEISERAGRNEAAQDIDVVLANPVPYLQWQER
jgi:hypothetical protein